MAYLNFDRGSVMEGADAEAAAEAEAEQEAGLRSLHLLVENSRTQRSNHGFVNDQVDRDASVYLDELLNRMYLEDELEEEAEDEMKRASSSEQQLDELGKAIKYWYDEQKRLRKMGSEELEREKKFATKVDAEDVRKMARSNKDNRNLRMWARFDTIFGILILCNGFVIFLNTDGIVPEDSTASYYLEVGFTALFSLEWAIRWYFTKAGFRGMISDRWSAFDLFLIVISVVDICVLSLLTSIGFDGHFFTILRILRLVRLVRLVRLLRLMKQLWLMTSGIIYSIDLVVWGLGMIGMVGYIFALFLFEILDCTHRRDAEGYENYCGKMWSNLITQFKVCTFDGTTDLRNALGLDKGPWILVLSLIFVGITSIGILNLIVGVMLNSTIMMVSIDKRIDQGTSFIRRNKYLQDLRSHLSERCLQDSGSGVPMITEGQLKGWLREEMENVETWDAAESEFKDKEAWTKFVRPLHTLLAGADLSEDDIFAVFSEIKKISGERPVVVDDFMEGCMWVKGHVHALDVLSIMSSLNNIYARMDHVSDCIRACVRSLTTTVAELESSNPDKSNQAAKSSEPHAAYQSREAQSIQQATQVEEKKGEELQRFQADAIQQIAKFDGIMCAVIFANAVTLGIYASTPHVHSINIANLTEYGDSGVDAYIFLVLECMYVILYTFESITRVFFWYQIQVLQSLKTKYSLPKIMLHLDLVTLKNVILWFPEIFKYDNTYAFELFLVACGLLDVLVFQFVGDDAANLTILQAFRLTRLLRFLRLIYRNKDVNFLWQAFNQSVMILFWSFLMLVTVIYMFALVSMVIVSEDPTAFEDEQIALHWGSVGHAMLTMASIATFSDWASLVDEVGRYSYFLYFVNAVFIVITSLGIMNLITGVMIETAFHIVTGQAESTRVDVLNDLKETLTEGTKEMFDKAEREYKENRRASKELLVGLCQQLQTQHKEEYKKQGLRWKEDEDICGESVFNKDSICVIKLALWVARHQVCIDYKLESKLSKDPNQAILHWEGGSMTPSLIFTDDELKPDRGKIIFSFLPPCACFEFSFGDGFSYVHVFPELLEGHVDNHPLMALQPVERPYISIRELNTLLDDGALLAKISLNGLRADQLLMVFHKLELTGTGKVDAEKFIDAILRLKQPIQGLDVAAAKSMTRRLMLESTSLYKGSTNFSTCAKAVIRKLRGVLIKSSDEVDDEQDENAMALNQIRKKQHVVTPFEEQKGLLIYKRRKLKKKVERLSKHVESRKKLLMSRGDDLSGFTQNDTDVESVDSMRGWD